MNTPRRENVDTMRMETLLVTPEYPIRIGATGMDALIQNIRIIVTTLSGSVPLDRAFASTGSFIDAPSTPAILRACFWRVWPTRLPCRTISSTRQASRIFETRAQVRLRFWCTALLEHPVLIPAGTRVSTPDQLMLFRTDTVATILPCNAKPVDTLNKECYKKTFFYSYSPATGTQTADVGNPRMKYTAKLTATQHGDT